MNYLTSPRLRFDRRWITLLVFCALGGDAFAHTDGQITGGMISGLLHPVTGLDHIIAMVAVGLWGAQLGRPLLWLLPIVFPSIMAVGGAMGVRGFELPGIEIGIALSGVLLGLMVALHLKPPAWGALALVAFFAIFHGYAHGKELPSAAHPLAYGIGFVTATGLLHLCGITLGTLNFWKPTGPMVVRFSGATIMLFGGWFLVRAFIS